MNEEELRAMVREAIARVGHAPAPPLAPGGSRQHPSHILLPLARGGDSDGACLIEPAVRCNHCGYCVSYGH